MVFSNSFRIFTLLTYFLLCSAVSAQGNGSMTLDQRIASCAACHGKTGVATDPQYPHLAGQHESYLIKTLRDYKSGERKNVVMAGMAAGLSDSEIKALAEYYASQDGPLFTPTP